MPIIESTRTPKNVNLQYVRAYSDVLQSDFFADETSRVKMYSAGFQRWEYLISKIDSTLSTLPIEDETGIIEQYLSMIKEKITIGPKTAEMDKAFSLCRQRLGSISDRWAALRRSKIEKIMNLELEASRVKDEIKELEVRYSVGEIFQQLYEVKISSLQTNLKKVEYEVTESRSSMDDMDMKIFRCSECVEGKSMKTHRKIVFSTFFILIVLLSQALYDSTYSNNGSTIIGVQALRSPIGDDVPARYNVTLWVRDWANKTSYGDVNVTILDPQGQRSTSYLSNQTGYINLRFIEAGSYVISVQKANRTIGYQEININQNATHLIKTWSYDFNMTLVDKQGSRLANHTVMLYDQLEYDAPKFAYESGAVVRRQNVTLVTEELGSLVRQAKTDNNGTLSFLAVWNGTYRMKIIGVETEIREYVLGELVITKIPPAVGEGIMVFQNPTNITLPCLRVDFQLHLVAASDFNVTNAQVFTRDMNGHLFFEDNSNETGYVEHKNVYIINGEFAVTARYGNRTIGYKEIEVTETKVFTIKCWMNNLTVTCIDLDGEPLVGYVILLYDQVIFYSPTNVTVVTNQTMQLINWTKTDENGVVRFSDLWNGTYWITVSSGEIVKEMIINLQKMESFIIIGEKTYMSLSFVTRTGQPLSGALVRVYDDSENLVFWEHTDSFGHILRQSLRLGSLYC